MESRESSVGFFFFFQAEDGIRDLTVTGVQTCALPIFQRAVAALRDRLDVDAVRDDVPGAPGAERSWRAALVGLVGALPRSSEAALAVGGVLVAKKLAFGLAALLLLGVGITATVLLRPDRVDERRD